jgi:hypothetical protein
MRALLRYSLSALTAAGLLAAQGHGGGGHHGEGGNNSRSAAAAYSGIPNQPVIGPMPLGSRPQDAGFPPVNRGSSANNPTRYGWPSNSTRINRTIRGRDHDRNRGLSYYPLVAVPSFGYGYGGNWYDPTDYAPYALPPENTSGEGTANLLGEQIQRLSAEVDSLRNANYNPPPPQQDDPPAPAKPIVIVLHSGQKVEVQSYAIMNGVLWDFTKQNSRRIPLASIDAPASAKATDDAGGSFPEGSFATNPN